MRKGLIDKILMLDQSTEGVIGGCPLPSVKVV